MFGLLADCFFFEKMSSGLVFRLHFTVYSILKFFRFVLEILLLFFQLIIEHHILFEVLLVLQEQRMLYDTWKCHSFLTVHHKNALKEVLEFSLVIFHLLLLTQSSHQTEAWVAASSVYLSLHVMAFKRVLSKQHEVEKNTQRPNVHWYTVVTIAYDLRSHILLSSTVSFGSHPSNRPGESKICNFISEVVAFFFEEDILAFDISVDEIFLMDALEPLHDFYYHFDSVLKRKNFAW